MMSDEELEEILWGDNPNYENVTGETIEGQSRWRTMYSKIVKHVQSDIFYRLYWSQGSTEYQDEGPENIAMEEVIPVEKTVIVYESKK